MAPRGEVMAATGVKLPPAAQAPRLEPLGEDKIGKWEGWVVGKDSFPAIDKFPFRHCAKPNIGYLANNRTVKLQKGWPDHWAQGKRATSVNLAHNLKEILKFRWGLGNYYAKAVVVTHLKIHFLFLQYPTRWVSQRLAPLDNNFPQLPSRILAANCPIHRVVVHIICRTPGVFAQDSSILRHNLPHLVHFTLTKSRLSDPEKVSWFHTYLQRKLRFYSVFLLLTERPGTNVRVSQPLDCEGFHEIFHITIVYE